MISRPPTQHALVCHANLRRADRRKGRERILREQLQQRLEELKQEFESGHARLGELEVQEARLRETLLRISGAIQVLEETLAAGVEQNAPPA